MNYKDKPKVISESCFGNYNSDDPMCDGCEVDVECRTESKRDQSNLW